MKTKPALRTTLLFLAAIVLLSFKSEDPITKILKALQKVTEKYPQEKVHIHTDKDIYALGETIWLKAYTVLPQNNIPSPLSRVLYVDLINENRKIKTITLPIDSGLAFGNMEIPDSIPAGKYRVRSYTNYMRNFSDRFFFDKQIMIGNVMDTTIADTKIKKEQLQIQFFPEGGYLIDNIRMRVGIKATKSDGFGKNLTGYIVDGKNNKITDFSTLHAGLGVLAITPKFGEKYYAIVESMDGKKEKFDFPEVKNGGLALSTFQNQDKITVRVSTQSNVGDSIILIGHTNGEPYAVYSGIISKGNMSAVFEKNKFPTGIAHFTLFDKNSTPLAERVLFVENEQRPVIELQTRESQRTREKTAVKISSLSADAKPIQGNFSISVTEDDIVQSNEDDQTSILSNLLLNSDLRGFIEKPNYYFNPENQDRAKHLDLLMMTQGWTRFKWKDILAGKEPEIDFKIEQGITISGQVFNEFNKPWKNAKISLLPISKGAFLKLDTTTNDRGMFSFDDLQLPDSSSFLVQSKSKKDSKMVKIKITPSPTVSDLMFSSTSTNMNRYLESTLKSYAEMERFGQLSDGILLKKVTITGKNQNALKTAIPGSANVRGFADHTFSQETIELGANIFTSFYKIPGLVVRNNIIYKLQRGSITSNKPMMLFVDGVEIDQESNPTFLAGINQREVKGIEVLTSQTSLVMYGATTGVVFITTKRGPDGGFPATNVAKLMNIGYATPKQFYVPNFDDPKTSRMKNLSSTVYWNPMVNIDQNGKAEVNFSNNDLSGKYKITIEGIDFNGNLLRKVMTYVVNPNTNQ